MTREATALNVRGRLAAGYETILTKDALGFLANLVEAFGPRRTALLAARAERQRRYDLGQAAPDFLPETKTIRESDWSIRGIPHDLLDRRVEITGPTDRKMVINAVNAPVKAFMADFEDSLAPTWANVVEGQINLRDTVNRTIAFDDPVTRKSYRLTDKPAVLICRVRGLHLPEAHVLLNGEAIPGALFDFALYFHHNHRRLLADGSGPYFYVPKLEHHDEARWWSEVFAFAEDHAGLARGTIKATFLIETLPAAFQMDEILYAARDHVVALNCGRWDYIFSYIKTLAGHSDRVLPDRQTLTMDKPFLDAYSRLLVRCCHRRGALAMGGMSAFIPMKDPAANTSVLASVKADKQREARNGHDGAWIAHPGLAETVTAVFDEQLGDRPNQLHVKREDDAPTDAAELLSVPPGPCSEEALRRNIRVALQYLEAWLSGNGCVPIYGLMEDAATAEISRSSIWQWLRHRQRLENGRAVEPNLFAACLAEECERVRNEVGSPRYETGRFERARTILRDIILGERFEPFLTLAAYPELARLEAE